MNHRGTKQLQTERLLLRKLHVNDAKQMYENWASDKDVVTFLTWPVHNDVEVTKNILLDWMESYHEDRFYQWGIEIEDTKTLIGTMSVVEINDKIKSLQIGYCIGSQWWHQGYTSEALTAVIDYLFNEVGCNRIEAKHDPRNPHSGAVMRKCGMKYEGTLRQSDINNQGICDTCYYSILRNEWEIKQVLEEV